MIDTQKLEEGGRIKKINISMLTKTARKLQTLRKKSYEPAVKRFFTGPETLTNRG